MAKYPLVERLRERESAALADSHRTDMMGDGELSHQYDDESRFYGQAADLIEAMGEALAGARQTIIDLTNSRGSEAEGTDADWVGDIDAILSRTRHDHHR